MSGWFGLLEAKTIPKASHNGSQLAMYSSERFSPKINTMKVDAKHKNQLLSNYSKSKIVAQETFDNPGQSYWFSISNVLQ